MNANHQELLVDSLSSLRIMPQAATYAGGVEIIGLRSAPTLWQQPIRWAQDALDDGSLTIGEFGIVRTIRARNTGDIPVFLPTQTLLGGGWQNRVVERPYLVFARNEQRLEVRCVEKGRWDYTQPTFNRAISSPLSFSAACTEERLRTREANTTQHRTWSSVSTRLQRQQRHSPTQDLFESLPSGETVAPPTFPGACGVAVLRDGALQLVTWTAFGTISDATVSAVIASCSSDVGPQWTPNPAPRHATLAPALNALTSAPAQQVFADQTLPDCTITRLRARAQGVVVDLCTLNHRVVHAQLWVKSWK